jgi:hypothetical protein
MADPPRSPSLGQRLRQSYAVILIVAVLFTVITILLVLNLTDLWAIEDEVGVVIPEVSHI